MTPQQQFLRWWVHQLRTYDCDSSIFMMKYVIDRMELNTEQRFWFCWIYANTYQVATAWVIFNEFPDYENTPQARIARWSHTERHRLPYQKDQKWLRGNLGDTFKSYQDYIGEGSQQERFAPLTNPHTARLNFDTLWWAIIDRFHRFGRYTAWFYMQALSEICGLKLEPPHMFLSSPSSVAPRAGLCYAIGEDFWATKGHPMDEHQYRVLNYQAAKMLSYIRTVFPELELLPVRADYFSMETSLCSFKKLFRTTNGRYLGYYLDRQAEDITKTASMDWPGINWRLLWDARHECLLPQLVRNTVDKSLYSLYTDTDGSILCNDSLLQNQLDSHFLARTTQHPLL